MCIIGGQLIGKSGSLILVNFTNPCNAGFEYLSCCWFAPYLLLHCTVRHTPGAGAVPPSPCAGRQLNFHQSLPQQVSVGLHVVEERMTHRNPHSKKRLFSHDQLRLFREGAVQVGRYAKGTRAWDALSIPWDKSTA